MVVDARKLLSALVLALGLTACHQATPTVSAARISQINSIGVVGAVDDDWLWMDLSLLGSDQVVSGTEWRLGQRAEKLTESLLAVKYRVVPIELPNRAALARMPDDEFGPALGKTLEALPDRPDAILVMRKGTSVLGSKVANGPSSVDGFGVYRKPFNLLWTYIAAYAVIEYRLYDGKTFERLAVVTTEVPNGSRDITPLIFLKQPYETAQLDDWTARFEEQPIDKQMLVRTQLTHLEDVMIPYTLRKMHLIP